VIIYRQLPGEEHMCLVTYTSALASTISKPMMTALESPEGQRAQDLAEVLNRVYAQNGQLILQALHFGGHLKKVQTERVLVTPNVRNRIRLSELNSLINEMATGEEATKRMAEMDAARGLQDPTVIARRARGDDVHVPATQYNTEDSNVLAASLRTQAATLEAQAKAMLEQAAKMLTEAQTLAGPSVHQVEDSVQVTSFPAVEETASIPEATAELAEDPKPVTRTAGRAARAK
jgi:hypothetical protein